MDAGCYAVSLLRLLSGEQPRVVSAEAELARGSKVSRGIPFVALLRVSSPAI